MLVDKSCKPPMRREIDSEKQAASDEEQYIVGIHVSDEVSAKQVFETERARGADQIITTLIKAVLEAVLVELDPATVTMSKIQSCSSAEQSSTLLFVRDMLGVVLGCSTATRAFTRAWCPCLSIERAPQHFIATSRSQELSRCHDFVFAKGSAPDASRRRIRWVVLDGYVNQLHE